MTFANSLGRLLTGHLDNEDDPAAHGDLLVSDPFELWGDCVSYHKHRDALGK